MLCFPKSEGCCKNDSVQSMIIQMFLIDKLQFYGVKGIALDLLKIIEQIEKIRRL